MLPVLVAGQWSKRSSVGLCLQPEHLVKDLMGMEVVDAGGRKPFINHSSRTTLWSEEFQSLLNHYEIQQMEFPAEKPVDFPPWQLMIIAGNSMICAKQHADNTQILPSRNGENDRRILSRSFRAVVKDSPRIPAELSH